MSEEKEELSELEVLKTRVQLQDKLIELLYEDIFRMRAMIASIEEVLIMADLADSEQLKELEGNNLGFIMNEMQDNLRNIAES